mgnify:CR=1 FL=1
MTTDIQNGWNEYSKLVIAELERLNSGIIDINVEIQEIKRDISTLKIKEDNVKEIKKWKDSIDEVTSPTQLKENLTELTKLKTFKTQAITIWIVVQFLFTVALAVLKYI